MKCNKCGREIEVDLEICPYCQAEIIRDNSEEVKEETEKRYEEVYDEYLIKKNRRNIHSITTVLVLLISGSPVIVLMYYMTVQQILDCSFFIMALHFIMLFLNLKISLKYDDEDINRTNRINIILIIISVIIYMVVNYNCYGFFNMSCPG